MKNYIILLASFFVFLFLFTSCEKTKNFLDIPLQGTIKGVVYDSLTQRPIPGVILTATYLLPDNDNGEIKNLLFETASNGSYILKDVWDEVYVKVEKPGFETKAFTLEISRETKDKPFDITLIGMPGMVAEEVSDHELDYTANDTASVHVEIRDLYNDNTSGEYKAYILFYEINSDLNVCVRQLYRKFPSQTFITLVDTLTANCFPDPQGVPTQYSYYYEIVDPDGNFIVYGLDFEDLDTLTVF